MTIALIVLIIFLCFWFNDSTNKLLMRQKRKKVDKLENIDMQLQEEIYLKHFEELSNKIENADLPTGDETLDFIICRQGGSAFVAWSWSALDYPCSERKFDGNQIDEAASRTTPWETPDNYKFGYVKSLCEIDPVMLIHMVHDTYSPYHCYSFYTPDSHDTKTSDISAKEEYQCINNWKLWLLDKNHSGYKFLYKKNTHVILYALFKEQIDDLYKKLLNANLIKIDTSPIISIKKEVFVYGYDVRAHKNKFVCADGYSKYNIPEDDGSEEYKNWMNITQNLEIKKFTRMQAILLNEGLRVLFLNYLCLLTQKELYEKGYGFSHNWDGRKSNNFYEPTDEEVKETPWRFS